MQIVIIGSGNVATVLSRLIHNAGHTIVQVYSRDINHANILAQEVGATAISDLSNINADADLYVVAVSDEGLYQIAANLKLPGKLVVHTAGSIPKGVLSSVTNKYGVLYPLQSLRKEMHITPPIPLLTDAVAEHELEIINEFAKTLSPVVSTTGDEERTKLHVGAVIVSNFTNHLYALAEEFCSKENIDFKMLLPLIQETANRMDIASPAKLQTGPALRNDFVTLDKHMKILATHPKLRYLYIKLTDSIMSV